MISNIETINKNMFLYINAGDNTPSWLISLATVIANGLIYLLPLLLLSLWLWGDRKDRELAFRSGVVTLSALGANQIIGLIWQHPRPFMINLGHTWIEHVPDSSFPSDHLTVFISVFLTLLLGRAYLLASALFLTSIAVAWARIFLGVHFPLDMLGAIFVVSAMYFIVGLVWRFGGESLINLFENIYRKIMVYPINRGWIRK